LRQLVRVGGLAALLAYAVLAGAVYSRRADTLSRPLPDAGPGWFTGPPARALSEAAGRLLRGALENLVESQAPAERRDRAYRDDLSRAEQLLIRSLRVQPSQAGALARLAAIRWELRAPPSPEEREIQEGLIHLAARMAPRVPRVHQTIGRLFLKMGRQEEALSYLGRAVELDPERAGSAVHLLRAGFVAPGAIQRSLPDIPPVLEALKGAYFDSGEAAGYLDLLEARLSREDPRIVAAFGDACLEAGQPARLVAALHGLAPAARPPLRAEVLMQRSRGLTTLDDHEAALRDATEASTLLPEDTRVIMHLARTARRAGRHGLALETYRKALRIAARVSSPPSSRAWLYAQIGQLQEELLRPDKAYDSYRRAIELDPGQSAARERIRELERILQADPSARQPAGFPDEGI
jgi:tetratricopeptide (TPR) repeat protein